MGSGTFTVGITDPQIPENNGTFQVEFRDGQAVRVRKTEEEADVTMPINAFSALISGVCALPQAAAWMPEVSVRRENPALAGCFYQKPMYLVDYF